MILSVNIPFSSFALHCPSYFSTAFFRLGSPKPWAKVSSFVVPFVPGESGAALFSTMTTSMSRTRFALTVISRLSSGSFSLASMALSRAFPKMVLISSGSRKEPASKEMAALNMVLYFEASQ